MAEIVRPEIVSGEKVDLESDGRLFNGFQYKVRLRGGEVDYLRDAEPLSKVRERLLQAQIAAKANDAPNATLSVEALAAGQVIFDGAQAIEGEDEKGEGVIGPLSGRGYVEASDVIGLAYSSVDGTETPNHAYESTIALMDVQREGIALQNETTRQQIAGAAAGAEGKTEGSGESLL